MNFSNIKVIAFDADDTLWDNQHYYEQVEQFYCELLSDYGTKEEVSAALFQTESANMPLMGYGTKAFIISLIENALAISKQHINANKIARIVDAGKSLLSLPVRPLSGVEEVLQRLYGHYRLVVYTKGELLDQENKLKRSGLLQYFSHVKIVSNKTPQRMLNLCKNMEVQPKELLMVGNSFKSDVLPAIEAGAFAVYVPFNVMWKHEVIGEYPHDRILKINQISELAELLLEI